MVLWPGRVTTRSVAIAGVDRVAVHQPDVGAERLGTLAQKGPEGLVARDDLLWNAVIPHQRVGEAPVVLDGIDVALGVAGSRSSAAIDAPDRRLIVAARPKWSTWWSSPARARCPRRAGPCARRPSSRPASAAAVAQACVDERQRVAADQPGVHGPDVGQRQRDLHNARVHEVTSSMAQSRDSVDASHSWPSPARDPDPSHAPLSRPQVTDMISLQFT